MSSSIKMEEYRESELSDIFWAKLVAKNIMLGPSETYFMHMRVKCYSHSRYSVKVLCSIIKTQLSSWKKKSQFAFSSSASSNDDVNWLPSLDYVKADAEDIKKTILKIDFCLEDSFHDEQKLKNLPLNLKSLIFS